MNADGFYFKQLPFCFIGVYLRESAADLVPNQPFNQLTIQRGLCLAFH